MVENDDVLDAQEAAAYLKINIQTVRRLARTDHLPAFRVGGGWRFKRSWLNDWAKSQAQSPSQEHVLVIDDDQNVLTTIKRLLEKEGFEVSIAASGVEALDLMNADVPDIVFLDLSMPEMDGPTILKEIRRRHATMAVIIFTAYPDSELMSRALEYPPITLLPKPASPELIIKTARAAIVKEE